MAPRQSPDPASPATAANPPNTAHTAHTPDIPDEPLQPITAVQASSGEVASLSAPADLWDRIRRGFAMPDLQHALVQEREQWYAARPDYMQRMTERSSKYLFHIVEEIERRGMPTELALLPYIESAFNPQAISSAKAAGMWQFMPATGNYFDLKQNAFRDDRRDVLASTRAALDYLQKLYTMFGDWHLALAAYNWGEGRVARAIARNQKQGLGTGYTDLSMPAETRLYVPKLQAVKNIVAHPEAFDTELPLIENHPYFQTVDIPHDIDVALVATLAGVREADFRALNPSLHRPVILAAGTPQILLPWDNAKLFQHNLQAHRAGQYASWTVWTVPATMSVAEAAQRTGMSESELRSLNQIPPRMRIKAGSALMVPRSGASQDVSSHLADNGQLGLTPEPVTRRTTVRAGKGDTVASIARRYKLAAASVARWNGVRAHAAFKTGQSVVVYLPVRQARGKRQATSARRPRVSTANAR
ncbi:LysM peptidoglycan-binding domain-containing protein [Verminephrobacter eiseniae]|nr:LysM peptidoglycan-binding domain-containing protein [Verminephrobacter eiseniae]MCW5305032.1 LysM peptidoglycan-binding domain-containing protein [Verminephrobacter eiseniae]MCW8180980.1 LysM peptidoglycan-binding domain-containing protein [Verminephrobacter eiseniae]MCW8190140.1 LysM peptidoglycan-binding domain-containing protein [Verminephrobacter eiseniae]